MTWGEIVRKYRSGQGRLNAVDEKPQQPVSVNVATSQQRSAARRRRLLAGEGLDFVVRKTSLLEQAKRVFAERRHPFRRRDLGAGHAKRQVEHLEGSAAILDF